MPGRRLITPWLLCVGLALTAFAGAWAQPGPPPPRPPGGIRPDGTPPDEAVTNAVSIQERTGYRYITANGIPDHAHGRFPNAHNPNYIRPQSYLFRVPLHPAPAPGITVLRLGPFGVALNGVLFDPSAAEWWRGDPGSGWQYEALGGGVDLGMDANNAHVQPNGAYHYHGIPKGMLDNSAGERRLQMVGYAADGFPIYVASHGDVRSSYRVRTGSRPGGPGGRYDGTFVEDYEYVAGLGDLDECNGRTGPTPEYPNGTYYYVLTADFPFIPRCFRGTPDPSFLRHGPPPGRRPPPRRMPPERLP